MKLIENINVTGLKNNIFSQFEKTLRFEMRKYNPWKRLGDTFNVNYFGH